MRERHVLPNLFVVCFVFDAICPGHVPVDGKHVRAYVLRRVDKPVVYERRMRVASPSIDLRSALLHRDARIALHIQQLLALLHVEQRIERLRTVVFDHVIVGLRCALLPR